MKYVGELSLVWLVILSLYAVVPTVVQARALDTDNYIPEVRKLSFYFRIYIPVFFLLIPGFTKIGVLPKEGCGREFGQAP